MRTEEPSPCPLLPIKHNFSVSGSHCTLLLGKKYKAPFPTFFSEIRPSCAICFNNSWASSKTISYTQATSLGATFPYLDIKSNTCGEPGLSTFCFS